MTSLLLYSEGRRRSQAAKLKCILSYFNRAAEEKCDLDGVITLRRQVGGLCMIGGDVGGLSA